MAGRRSSGSKSRYYGKTNPYIINKVLDNPRVHYPQNRKKWKVPSFYYRYFSPTNNVLHITTDPLNMPDNGTRPRFLSFIRTYETNNNVRVCDMSKNELLYSFFDFVEHTNSIVALKDDSQQFVPYRFKFPDVMKLYLYKSFYPQIFDYDIVYKGKTETIKFKSEYMEENFSDIYRNMEFLFIAILYDALIIAIERTSVMQISSMKTYDIDIDPKDSVQSLKKQLKELLDTKEDNESKKLKKKKSDPREKILEMFIPSIIFFAKHHRYLYKKRDIRKVLITSTMKFGSLYRGNRADESRAALSKTRDKCYDFLNQKPYTFNRLLNLYHINRKTNLFDLQMIKDNSEFKPYLFDGIIIKHLINKMISDNSQKLEQYEKDFKDYDCSNQRFDKSLSLSSVHVNPNCIVDNLTIRDYEAIDYIISNTAKSMQMYYLKEDGTDVPPSKICDVVKWIAKEKYTDNIVEKSPELEFFGIDNVDFESVMFFNQLGVGMEG